MTRRNGAAAVAAVALCLGFTLAARYKSECVLVMKVYSSGLAYHAAVRHCAGTGSSIPLHVLLAASAPRLLIIELEASSATSESAVQNSYSTKGAHPHDGASKRMGKLNALKW